jgi:hypothetical protein
MIVIVNEAWLSFADENDARNLTRDFVLGKSLWEFITDKETRHLYQIMLDKVRTSKSAITIPFRCDSPNCRRYMELKIEALTEDLIQFSSRILKQEFRDPNKLLDESENRSNQTLTICGWCKKVKAGAEWVEVEEAIEYFGLYENVPIPQLTHGMCPTCSENLRRELASLKD